MTALKFDFEDEPRDDDPDMANLWILRDYLLEEPGMTLQVVSQKILDKISTTEAEQSMEAADLAGEIMRVADRIPPDEDALHRLVDLTFALYDSHQWVKGGKFNPWHRLLSESIDAQNDVGTELTTSERSGPGDISPDVRYRNFHAFNAQIRRRAGWDKDGPSSWALSTLSFAHEGAYRLPYIKLCDAYALAAAQWILIDGDNIYHFVLECHTHIVFRTGPVWAAKANQLEKDGVSSKERCKQRWLFWQSQFEALAEGERDDEFPFAEITKKSAAEAAEHMRWIMKGAAA